MSSVTIGQVRLCHYQSLSPENVLTSSLSCSTWEGSEVLFGKRAEKMGVGRGNVNVLLDLETSCQPRRAGERGRILIYKSWEGNFYCNIMTQEQTFTLLN